MHALRQRTSIGVFLAAAALVVAVEVIASAHLGRAASPTLVGTAITLDLVLGLPVLAWWLVLRRRDASVALLVPVALIGLLVAWWLVPSPHDAAVRTAQRALPLVEVVVLGYGIVHIRRLLGHYRRLRPAAVYGFDALEHAAGSTFGIGGRVMSAALTEVALGGLAVIGWRRHFHPPADATAYTTYLRNGYAGTLGVFIGAVSIEIVAVHLLVRRWSGVAAWLLSALSIYTLAWLLGDYHGLRLNPHVVDNRSLRVRAGLRWRVDLPLDAIERVRRYRVSDGADVLSLAVLGEPDVVVELDRGVVVRGLFGLRREATALGLSVDDVAGLVADVQRRAAAG